MNYDTIKLLGLQPEDVETLDLVKQKDQIIINLTLARKNIPCPLCGSVHSYVKDYKNKSITHSLFKSNKTVINYRARRYICKDCRKTFYEDNPLALDGHKISTATIYYVLKACKRCNYTFTSIAEEHDISVSSVINIFDQYVDMKRGKLPKVLSIDEFYLGKTWKNKFACVFINWESGHITDVFPSRKKYHLYSFMQYIDKKEWKTVKYVSMDMNSTYRDFAYQFFKGCTVMVDSFHVVKNINDCLKNLRIHTMNKYKKDSLEYYLLKNWKGLLMTRKGSIEDNPPKFNKKIGYAINKPQILELMLNIDPILKKAYEWKEDYLDFNEDYDFETAPQRYDELYEQLVLMNINEFQEVVSFLKNWRKEILNSFICIDGRRISNGPIESINSRIKMILRNALKYRNFERLRNRIMYCINKPSLPVFSNEKKTNKEPGKKRGSYKKNTKKHK